MSTVSINVDEIKQKLYEKLKPSGWANKLKTFILSEDFDKILLELHKQTNEGKRFTPVLKQVFRAFEECPYSELKVVIIGQDPYPQIGVADGISFSCSNTGKPEASLRYILGEIERTVYPEGGYSWDPDLKRWSNQGVLNLNTAFTTQIGKIGCHYDIWTPFMAFLLDILDTYNCGLIYVFLGTQAKAWSDHVSDHTHHKLFANHPASAAYKKAHHWDSGDLFNEINKLVDRYYKSKIIW